MHKQEMDELEKMKSEIAAIEEASRAAINQELDDIQAMIKAAEQMASRHQSKDQKQFTIKEKSRMLVEIIAERKRFFAAQRVAEQRSKPPTKAKMRNRMCTYLKNQAVVKDSGKKDKSSSKQARSRKKRAGLKLKPKLPKKLKVLKEQEPAEDEQEKKELRLCLKRVQDVDRAINYENLAMKSPIVDWETQLLGSDMQGEDLSYWKITRADRSFRFYKVFSTMIEEFDRQDMFNLHRLVMKMFESVTLEGYYLIL
nr:hypothetical protein [Tanacetum cinerariifolium]GEV31130.1 hypothetical protein [Tanacetum cinerariifolium]GEV47901.1 hypothetical protein [Tanacetum cinerariifolium]